MYAQRILSEYMYCCSSASAKDQEVPAGAAFCPHVEGSRTKYRKIQYKDYNMTFSVVESGYALPFYGDKDLEFFEFDKAKWFYEPLHDAVGRLNDSVDYGDIQSALEELEAPFIYDRRLEAFGIPHGHKLSVNLEATTGPLPTSFINREVYRLFIHLDQKHQGDIP